MQIFNAELLQICVSMNYDFKLSPSSKWRDSLIQTLPIFVFVEDIRRTTFCAVLQLHITINYILMFIQSISREKVTLLSKCSIYLGLNSVKYMASVL
jgi:hypothetical protein